MENFINNLALKLTKKTNFHNLTMAFALLLACSSVENVNNLADMSPDFVASDLSQDTQTRKQSLIDQSRWVQTEIAVDPFEPSDEATCDSEAGIGTETLDGEPTIAILTDFCPWATVEQKTLVPLEAGELVDFRVWHFELVGEGPARIILQVGDWRVLDRLIEKPHEAQLIAETVMVPAGFEKGSQVYFHVDNHGANEYSLVEFSKH